MATDLFANVSLERKRGSPTRDSVKGQPIRLETRHIKPSRQLWVWTQTTDTVGIRCAACFPVAL
jgi:hypothetical protein